MSIHTNAIQWALRQGFEIVEGYSPIQREGSNGFYVAVQFMHPDPEYWDKSDMRRKRHNDRKNRIRKWLKGKI